ncbi:MAG: DUF2279 domain-containing protein [Deltaproteobacteria bacterium]|jgi:hypothetical protein|nr:DUF2279 domain-containing protein [Deltaproteobacteria bacterium]
MVIYLLSFTLIFGQTKEAKKNRLADNGKFANENILNPEKVETDKKKNFMARHPVAFTAGGYVFAPLFMGIVGMQMWEWGNQTHFKAGSDGWLEQDQTHGGADKTSHMWSFYMGARLFSWYFKSVFPGRRRLAAVLGAGVSTLGGIAVEIGDGFATNYGFSYTDLVFDLAGVALGLAQELWPWFDDLFDFSLFLFPSVGYLSDRNDNKIDFITDYSGQMLAFHLRLGGIPGLKETFLKYFRFDLGYFTRCYQPYDSCSKEITGTKEFESRNVYLGFSFDFARIFALSDNAKLKSAGELLRYFNFQGFAPMGVNFDINDSGKLYPGFSHSW